MKRAAAILLLAACGPSLEDDAASQYSALNGAWQPVGNGVSWQDTGNVLGSNVFIGYAGYNIGLGDAQAWVSALYDARLRELGVRWVFAVQGPADSAYNGLEIGNSKITAALNGVFSPAMGFIVVAGHSSGSFVADEWLQQLDTGADPFGVYGARLVYFDLDGDQRYVAASGINRLRRAYYVNALNPVNGVQSPNFGAMSSLGGAYAAKGGTLQYDAAGSGCSGTWCVHISLVNTVPHASTSGGGIDYADFGGRPVNTWWLDARAQDASLGQCDSRFRTVGAIQGAYAALGGCASVLGAPSTDELPCPDGAGRYNHFVNGGSIYWTFFTGAHEVHGAIRARWEQLGWERSALGYPVSDELVTANGAGRYNRFERGAIYWSQATAAHEVVGKIYDQWAALNFENGELGWPTSDEQSVPGGRRTDFEHGAIIAYDDGRVEVVRPQMPQPAVASPAAPLPPGAVDTVSTFHPGEPAPMSQLPTGPVSGGCDATGAAPLLLLVLGHLLRRRATLAASPLGGRHHGRYGHRLDDRDRRRAQER